MITVRPADQRGAASFGWLDARHSFSFGHYHDPAHMGFRALRVINEDRIAPGAGFDSHGHRDMEIITYVLSGALEHKDNLGNGSVIRPGEVQRMTAGRGIVHSEHNHSQRAPLHLLQIWIQPESEGLEPGYEQRPVPTGAMPGALHLIADRDGRDGSVTVHQDVRLYTARLDAGDAVSHDLDTGRHAWLQVARGALTLNGQRLREGDGAAVSDETRLDITADEAAELLLFDLA